MFHLKEVKRYLLHMRNTADHLPFKHPRRHSFKITKNGDQSTSGILKDVVMLGGCQEMELDFTANNQSYRYSIATYNLT